MIVVVGAGAVRLTDDDGGFEIDGVPAGSYEVLAQREHLTADRRTVTVSAGETAEVEFVLGLSAVHEELTVTASDAGAETTLEAFNAVTTLDSFDIAAERANTIGEARQNEPGIASRSFGPGTSRPIIRGFDGDRVLILEDVVGTIGEALQNDPGIASRSFGPGTRGPIIRGFDGDRVLILEDVVGTIGEALQNDPGIASRSFGPGTRGPIIRGFDGDRVLILEDVVGTGDLCIPLFFN